MTTLVVGASGATGRWLVRELLARGRDARAIVRSPEGFLAVMGGHDRLTVIGASVLGLGDAEMARHVAGCDAVASCLGHRPTVKGIFGPPRRLVTDATRRLCRAIRANRPAAPVRFVLMNTAGNRNRDLDERVGIGQRCVVGLLRWLVPPHADNEEAADFLRVAIGEDDPVIEWAAVRPDGLIDADEATPTRSIPHRSGARSSIRA